jgi:hydroxymethylglutaryl-CoA reductase
MSKILVASEVMAWGILSDPVCREILGCSTTRLRSVIARFEDGSTRNGQMGQNINTANVIAAMFIPCGQDTASVFESGWSHLTADAYISHPCWLGWWEGARTSQVNESLWN